jgi:AAA+ superfamily predicted ATPase
MDFKTKIKNYKKAGYYSLFVLTHEEQRLVSELVTQIRSELPGTDTHVWDAQNGLVASPDNISPKSHPEETMNSTELLKYLHSYGVRFCNPEGTAPVSGDEEEPKRPITNIFILKDFHLHFDKVINIRLLRNLWNILKARGDMLVFVGHKFAIPGELEKEIQLVDYDLPREDSIGERLDYIHRSINRGQEKSGAPLLELPEEFREGAIEAAKGMTAVEIENAFAMGIVTSKVFNSTFVDTVFEEKIAQLKKNGLLTYIPSDISFENVGGLSGLKTWISSRKKAYSRDARSYGLPLPKGMLLCSVPGVGKTLLAKATAKELDCPLFQLDMGNIFDSHVGSSERNMREVIKVIESIGKSVILIDEIEKALSKDAVSGKGDTGVSSRIYGTFLSWLNDRTNPAFIVATSNDHTILPTPLIRKGRFDQLFWLDLPTQQERKEILKVVLKKYGRDCSLFALNDLAERAKDYTGAELEEVVKSALFRAFDQGEEITEKHIRAELKIFIPFAVSHPEDLQKMRSQAKGKLVMLSEEGEVDPVENMMRKMRIDIA